MIKLINKEVCDRCTKKASFKDEWKGDEYNLCWEHHREMKREGKDWW